MEAGFFFAATKIIKVNGGKHRTHSGVPIYRY